MPTILVVSILIAGGCGPSGHDHEHSDSHHGHDHRGHDDDHHHEDHPESSDSPDDDENIITFTTAQAQSVGLEVRQIQPEEFRQVIKATGELVAPAGQETVISATSNGILSFAKQNLNEGATVRSGAALAFISAKNIAEGDPQAKLRIQYETAERAFRRAETLSKEQLISQKAYEEALANYETAKAAHAGLQNANSGAGIRVSSPMDGYLKNRLAEEGAYVTVGQPIATVTRNKRLLLRAEVSQKYRQHMPAIRSANFKLPFSDQVYDLDSLDGQLASYGVATEASSAYLPISFELNNTGSLPTGTYVEVFLLTNPIANVLSLPKSALMEEQGTYSVFVKTGNETYRKQPVVLGEDNGKHVRILSGLQAGDHVVTKGAIQIKLANMNAAIPHGHSH